MKILNKAAIRDMMKNPPKGQKLYEAFDGEWDKLTDSELVEVAGIISLEFESIAKTIVDELRKRELKQSIC